MARQRGDKWQGDVVSKEHGIRLRHSFVEKAQAEAWELAAKAALLMHQEIPKPETFERGVLAKRARDGATWSEMAEACYLKHWRSAKSEKHIRLQMGVVERYFGADHPIASITAEDLDDFVEELRDAGSANGTINRKLSVISKVLALAEERGKIERKPKVPFLKEGQGRKRFISPAEEATLLAHMERLGYTDQREACIILLDTGLRPSELWRLKDADVNLPTNLITVWINKTDQPRSVPMTKRVRGIVEKRMGAGHLFPGADQGWLSPAWARARTLMGLDSDVQFVPYSLRHTFASRLVQRGVSIPAIRDLMGHRRIETTLGYAHLAPDNYSSAIALLEPGNPQLKAVE